MVYETPLFETKTKIGVYGKTICKIGLHFHRPMFSSVKSWRGFHMYVINLLFLWLLKAVLPLTKKFVMPSYHFSKTGPWKLPASRCLLRVVVPVASTAANLQSHTRTDSDEEIPGMPTCTRWTPHAGERPEETKDTKVSASIHITALLPFQFHDAPSLMIMKHWVLPWILATHLYWAMFSDTDMLSINSG